MDNLKDLHQLGEKLREDFEKVFVPEDIELPSSFKHSVTELGDYKYDYKKFLVHIYSDQLNGYIPNQWFIIASFFVDYYIEVLKYKELVIEKLKDAGLNKADDRKVILSKYTKLLTELSKTKPMSEAKKDATTLVRREISTIFEKLLIEDSDKEKLIRFVSDYDWWYGGKTIDRGDFYVSPILALAKVVNASHSYIAEICKFYADKRDIADNLKENYISTSSLTKGFSFNNKNQNLQQIFYGAPGTGKSHEIKRLTSGEEVIRTTFHPDSDYSTFVGSYKPTTQEETVMTVIGTKAVPVENADGTPRKENKIVYEFVNQAFLQAYINAWKMFADDEQNPKKQYLIIEEINRGNCAQIFGDLFQLLDRSDTGFSEYPIKTDTDMEKQLSKAFKSMSYLECPSIAGISGEDVARKIRNGEIMLLPPNLYIWATMNTSDQSLFPIDSAFKRRWDWKYLPIEDAGKNWKILVNGNEYEWYSFLKAINKEVLDLTHSEDKQLGYFFAKAQNGVIDANTLVNKVYFYLWNDVFKDYDIESQKAFKKADSNDAIAFKDFFDGLNIIESVAEQVLINIGLKDSAESQNENSN